MIARRECLTRWGRFGRLALTRPASTASSASSASSIIAPSKDREEAYLIRNSNIPLVKDTVGQMLQKTVDKFPERTAVVSHYQNSSITYHDLLKKADKLGAGLRALGLTTGDRVAVWGPNSLEWVVAKMACARAGLILATLNPAYQANEVAHCLRKVGAKGLICNHTFKTQNYHDIMLQVAPEIACSTPGNINAESLPNFKALITITDELLPGSLRMSEVIAAGTDLGVREVRNMQGEVGAHDLVEIQFTSGTTGSPKAAMLTHYNVVNMARVHNIRLSSGLGEDINERNVVCALVPFFHVFAGVIGLLASAECGDTLLIASPHFEAKGAYEAIKAEKASVILGAPTMFVDLLQELERNENKGMESIRVLYSGGAAATEELLRKLKRLLPQTIVLQGYGMTETSPCTFSVPPDVDDPNRVLTYVGNLMPHLEAKIVDTNGHTVAFGEPGELCIRGYVNCKGYWEDPDKTRELIDEQGWLRTGDQFILEEDGYARIVGRIKELVIRGGENIAPKELEDVLSTHPAVLEAAVYGVPDERMGEEVAAAIRLTDPKVTLTQEDMRAFLKGKIAHFKIPKYLDILTEFPKNAAGKVQKFKLRDIFVKRQESK